MSLIQPSLYLNHIVKVEAGLHHIDGIGVPVSHEAVPITCTSRDRPSLRLERNVGLFKFFSFLAGSHP